MNKWIFLLLFCLIGNYTAHAQLKFSPYSEALVQKAKDENKLIFYEFTASWCAPCKMMQKSVFTDAKVAETYNKHFICIQIDVDRDPHNIASRFEVSGVPNFIFTNPSGKIIYSETGYHEVDEFIELTEIPLAYQSGTTTPVQDLIIAIEQSPEQEDALIQDFMDTDKWKYKEGAELLMAMAGPEEKAIDQHFDQHRATYVQLAGRERVDLFLADRALAQVQEEIQEAIYAKKEPNWARTEHALKAQLGDRYLLHFYEIKALYFFYVEDWLTSIDYTVKATEEEVKRKKTANEKGACYLEVAKRVMDEEYDLERDITEEEEIKAYEIFYSLLKKAEQLLSPPTADLYEQLAYVTYILDRYDESDKYEELKEQAEK